jgi:hypothetical protein
MAHTIVQRPIRRLRRAPHLMNADQLRQFYDVLEVLLEQGRGVATGQGSIPKAMIRVSRDGGQTWGREYAISATPIGRYLQRVLLRRIGQARDVVFELNVTDPIAWAVIGASLEMRAGIN